MNELDAYASAQRPAIVLTAVVRQRLVTLVRTATLDPSVARFLHEELARADIVPEGAAGAVTIGSQVKFVDQAVFLSRSDAGWLVTAAACKPVPDKPYDCGIKGS